MFKGMNSTYLGQTTWSCVLIVNTWKSDRQSYLLNVFRIFCLLLIINFVTLVTLFSSIIICVFSQWLADENWYIFLNGGRCESGLCVISLIISSNSVQKSRMYTFLIQLSDPSCNWWCFSEISFFCILVKCMVLRIELNKNSSIYFW